eukprot:TRINITY_DN471_c0_g1_i12.p1 TRINITY_DN471_c0_g1~~TRINITY_DN471_c0_g1_i12.p1  ORF type:complete len:654 (-),score=110.43 TRINITY_DN471_c0_g1_i12:159-1886(-)
MVKSGETSKNAPMISDSDLSLETPEVAMKDLRVEDSIQELEENSIDSKTEDDVNLEDATKNNEDSVFDYHQVLRQNFHKTQHTKVDSEVQTKEIIGENSLSEKEDIQPSSENLVLVKDTVDFSESEEVVDELSESSRANVDTTESLVFKNETSIQQLDTNKVNVSNIDTEATNDDIKLETVDIEGEKVNEDITEQENMSAYAEEGQIKVDMDDEETETDINIPLEVNDILETGKSVENETMDVNEESENEGREHRMEIHDYGPIDRSLKVDPYFSDAIFYEQDGFGPPPLRDQQYFNSHFEISPSYDLRSSYFLRTVPSNQEFGEERFKQLVYQENHVDRKDKTIFGGVIGGLAGVFGFLASKKLILSLVGLATLLAMGITGTSPQELMTTVYEEIYSYLNITYSMNMNAFATWEADEEGNTETQLYKNPGGGKRFSYYSLEGPISDVYRSLEESLVSYISPLYELPAIFNEMWTSFTEGFMTVTWPLDIEESDREQRKVLVDTFNLPQEVNPPNHFPMEPATSEDDFHHSSLEDDNLSSQYNSDISDITEPKHNELEEALAKEKEKLTRFSIPG